MCCLLGASRHLRECLPEHRDHERLSEAQAWKSEGGEAGRGTERGDLGHLNPKLCWGWVRKGSRGPRTEKAGWGCLRSCPRGPPGGPKRLQQAEAGGSEAAWVEEGSWASDSCHQPPEGTSEGRLMGSWRRCLQNTHKSAAGEKQHLTLLESSTSKKLRSHIVCASVSTQSVPV